MALNLTEALEDLVLAKKAWRAALEVQSYSMSSGTTARSAQRQQVDAALRQVKYCESEVQRLNGSRKRIKVGIPAC